MVLGDVVPGPLMRAWRFVASDAADISKRVMRKDPDARLVANEHTGQLGVVHWFRREHMGAKDVEDEAQLPVQAHGGMWLLAIRLTSASGDPICGEPDNRVIDRMNAMDSRLRSGVGARAYVRWGEAQAKLAEEREAKELEEAAGAAAQAHAYAWLRGIGQKAPRIYVPGNNGWLG
jgi:hypothetical protein